MTELSQQDGFVFYQRPNHDEIYFISGTWVKIDLNSKPTGGGINFSGVYGDTEGQVIFAGIRGLKENNTDNNYSGALLFGTIANGGNISEKMRIDSAGKVGIGTTAPDAPLHVHKGSAGSFSPHSNADGIVVEDSANGGITIAIPDASAGGLYFGCPSQQVLSWIEGGYNSNAPYLSFAVDGEHRMRIDDSGNVGIGTTASYDKLTIKGTDARIKMHSSETDGGEIGIEFAHDAGAADDYAIKAAIISSADTAGNPGWARADMHFILDSVSDSNSFTINTDTKMIIKNDGKVGIGTTAPTDLLTVAADLSGNNNAGIHIAADGDDDAYLDLTEQGASAVAAFGASDAYGFRIVYDGGDEYLHFKSGNEGSTNSRMVIQRDNGRVGIGTTAPAAKLDVSGSIFPSGNGVHDLGSDTKRWNTVYTSDLSLKNDFGDWTIVEGEDNLFLYNNKKGKTYKFNLTEVDASEVPPKGDE